MIPLFVIYKVRGRNCYSMRRVAERQGRGRGPRRTLKVYSKCTTQEKATRQRNILQAYATRRNRA